MSVITPFYSWGTYVRVGGFAWLREQSVIVGLGSLPHRASLTDSLPDLLGRPGCPSEDCLESQLGAPVPPIFAWQRASSWWRLWGGGAWALV